MNVQTTLERCRHRFPNTPFRLTSESGPIITQDGGVTTVLFRPTNFEGVTLDRWTVSVIVGADLLAAQEYTASSPDGDRALQIAWRRARRHHPNANIPPERWRFGGAHFNGE